MPDRLPSLILLVGFWVPPLVAGRIAADMVRRRAKPVRPAQIYAVFAAFVVAWASAWFLFQLNRIPPYLPGATMDPTFAPPEAVARLALIAAVLVLPVSAIACWLGYRSRVRSQGGVTTARLLGLGASVVVGTTSCTPAPPAEAVVQGTDYAFQLPAQLTAGSVRFRFDNRGKVAHEMALGQLKAGVTADSLLSYAAKGGDPGDLSDGVVGILIAAPGQSAMGTLAATLIPGRTYMMICQFKDADSLPPHFAMGMQASFVAK